mmetsp:Transcript_43022/g.50324  ORF Transcript_43022/g.50324 Transcript_43022/m.50324 type:complete len:180 (-) Transcript_43022:636-1175(-)
MVAVHARTALPGYDTASIIVTPGKYYHQRTLILHQFKAIPRTPNLLLQTIPPPGTNHHHPTKLRDPHHESSTESFQISPRQRLSDTPRKRRTNVERGTPRTETFRESQQTDLMEFFKRSGVSAHIQELKIVTDWRRRDSKGYGFVVFREPIQATSALTHIVVRKLMGRVVNLNQGEKKR